MTPTQLSPDPDKSRTRILHAAIREFSEHGLAGARTNTIAAAAQVNKALLYYYFRDKESLYGAALEAVATQVAESALAVLDMKCSAGERLLRFVLQHFDRILSQQGFQALMQQEMVRFRDGQSSAMNILAKKAFEPIFRRADQIVREGMLSGELCRVDPLQMMYAALGANVFYFLSAPMVRLATPFDPLESSSIADRRRLAIEFLGHAIFTDRRHGAQLARQVLATMPIPEHAFQEKKTA
ncbi:MAG TPA: TetR/AcrR family transcriptional regulator [Acidobacteriaceae bacterium]|jgi:TetR/AcrR family transcriptional regulator|nr:TetR/AcrR family transcriptional regulator [Acidobacteriaceae bacterium]